MFVFTNVWDYFIYNAVVNNSTGILYVIFLAIYIGFILSNLHKNVFNIKAFSKLRNNGPFNVLLFVISVILGHIATIYTGKFVVYLIEKFSLY